MNSELMCLTCGAVVRDAKLHSAWHVAEARGETEVPLPTASQPEAPMTWWEKEQKETLQKFHEYASRNGAIPGDDVFLFALRDAEAYRSSKQEMTCRCCHASTRDFNPYPCCGHCGAMLLPDAGPKPDASAGADVTCRDLLWDETLAPGSQFTFHDVNDDIVAAFHRGEQVVYKHLGEAARAIPMCEKDRSWLQTMIDEAARRIGLQPDNKAVDAQENEGRN